MRHSVITTLLLLVAALPTGAQEEAEPAPGGALPGQTSKGEVIGSQPGPNRSLPKKRNPYGLDQNALAEGRRLFVWFNCSGCHGGRGGGGMGPSLRDVTWRYGFTHQDIFNSIADGRRYGMPAWGTKLPAEQIWKITSYIKSMGTDIEPQPPPPNPVYSEPPPERVIQLRQERKEAN